MAIDSERKRKSIAGVARTFRPKVIFPDGSFDQGDRQNIGWSYSGILAGGGPSGRIMSSLAAAGGLVSSGGIVGRGGGLAG